MLFHPEQLWDLRPCAAIGKTSASAVDQSDTNTSTITNSNIVKYIQEYKTLLDVGIADQQEA